MIATLTLLVASAAAVAADATPQVTVEAQRRALEDNVHHYIENLTQVNAGAQDDALQRWRLPICFLVGGLTRDKASFVLERLIRTATTVGAPLAKEEPCRPDLYVLFTVQPKEVLKAWQRHDATLYGFAWPKSVGEFVDTPRPVRVWYNTDLKSAAGADLAPGASQLTVSDMPANNFAVEHAPSVRGVASRLQYNVVRDFQAVIVLVDLNSAKGLDLGAISDYVVMTGLTRVRIGADFSGAATILRLFESSGEPAPAALTPWDRSYLKALYDTPREVKGQRVEIAKHMFRDMANAR